MSFEEIDGNQIYYEVQGDGHPILMIQGLSANTDWWDSRLIETLTEDFKVITFDNRGAGRSESPDKDYSLKELADDASGLMDSLETSSAHVLGVSMGGMIAQELALNYPAKVDDLVLCSTNCGGSESVQASEEVLETLYMDRSSMSDEELVEKTIPILFTQEFIDNNPDFIELFKGDMIKNLISKEDFIRQIKAVMDFDAYDRLPQIKSRTLILHGQGDILVPPQNAEILAEAIPNSEVVYFENSAHLLMEEMGKVAGTVLEFLRS